MQGLHHVVRNVDQLDVLLNTIRQAEFPFTCKVSPVASPKSSQQIRYAHSLCGALAAHKGVSPEWAKRDAKAEYGKILVSTSLITGNRSAMLQSFADYTRDEMEAFITQMEVHLSTEGIDYVAAE